MSILVMKFGGTSLANVARIERVSKLVKDRIKLEKTKIILVVSAMSGVTNKLIAEYKKINKDNLNPEYDVILSSGEQCSSAIVSMILQKKKLSLALC